MLLSYILRYFLLNRIDPVMAGIIQFSVQSSVVASIIVGVVE